MYSDVLCITTGFEFQRIKTTWEHQQHEHLTFFVHFSEDYSATTVVVVRSLMLVTDKKSKIPNVHGPSVLSGKGEYFLQNFPYDLC